MQCLEKMMFLHLIEEAFDTGFYLFKPMCVAFSDHLLEIGKE